jgi:16S rRNA processing protein RimM
MENLVLLGYLQRPWGLNGGLMVKLFNDNSYSLAINKTVLLKKNDLEKILNIKSLTNHDKVFFEGISDLNSAKTLVGYQVFMNRSLLPKLADDEIYLTDLNGHAVIDANGTYLGSVIGFSSNNAQALIQVKTKDSVVSIPLIKPFVANINSENKCITTDLPMEFLDLFQEPNNITN